MKKEDDNVISLPSIVMNVAFMKMNEEIEELKKQQKKISESMCRSMLLALDAKDQYTYEHSTRVAYYSLTLGKELQLDENQMYELEMSGLFHDLGKIGTPDSILNKPTRLNEDEFEIMKQHPVRSGEILQGFKDFKNIANFVKHHHERYDGRGYPNGLKGEEIPLFSRILLIADTFDAMTSTRVYRKGLANTVAFAELEEFSGSQFDPGLVSLFIEGMKKEEKKKEKTFHLKIIGKDFEKQAA
jgi:putative nucleotidyltransferase with HDIG domain